METLYSQPSLVSESPAGLRRENLDLSTDHS